MCGIAGFFSPATASQAELTARAQAMGDAIAHRGPDDHGVWASAELGLALAHRRLSIIDLSPLGHQPMTSTSGRFVLVYNGEIYNYLELRAAVDAERGGGGWLGTSDTEVLLAAFELWGVARTLERANGMFGLALVDLERRVLVLARDRAGEKPLYYGWQGGAFLFGSELKALLAHPSAERVLDEGAVAQFLRFAYVPAPRSIYRGIAKLPAGSWVEIPLAAAAREYEPRQYWQWPVPGIDSRPLTVAAAAAELDPLLRRAIDLRTRADVPLGAFLSGGIDSSVVVALMQAQSARRVRTFSIGFAESAHDEAAFGRAVAERLGTDHTELRVTAADALGVVPSIGRIWDEPFADSSQIPTYLLARLTRQHVTVSLSGDAGDELFGGYVRYIEAPRLERLYARTPRSLRRLAARCLDALPGPRFDRALAALSPRLAVLFGGDRLHKLSAVLGLDGRTELYRRLVSQWPDPAAFYRRAAEPRGLIDSLETDARASTVDWMMLLDQRTYLPDDILVKVDRATMAVALESRVPFLDPDVIAFAARLPLDARVGGGIGKLVLRELLAKYLDRESFTRPKQGFAIPLADWLRGPLREWAESLLSHTALAREGLLDVPFVQRQWDLHVSGARNLHYPLWNILMLQAWLGEYRPRLP